MLLLGALALGLGGQEAWAQDVSVSEAHVQPSTPIGDSIARLTQGPIASTPARSRLGRHPVLWGTVIGAAGAVLWHASECHGSSCNTGPAALVGAGVGAYTGLVVSAVQSARAGRPVSRGVKTGLVVGAIGAVAGSWLACYGAGGCGGTS